MPTRTLYKGFTLIELLIALAVSALIFTMMIYGLKTVARNYQALETAGQRFKNIQTAFFDISRDLKNIAPRKITDENNKILPPLIGKPDYLELTVMTAKKLERRAYFIDNDKLIQRIFSVLDRAKPLEYKDKILLKNIISLEYQYINGKNLTFPQWPVDNQDQNDADQYYPAALRLTLVFKNTGKISRFFLVQKII